MRLRLGLFALLAVLLLVIGLVWWRSSSHPTTDQPIREKAGTAASQAKVTSDNSPIRVFAHNLLLRKGPNFRVYVRWLNGRMVPSSRRKNPSFDDPESFSLDITTGVLRANVGDLSNYLNTELKTHL